MADKRGVTEGGGEEKRSKRDRNWSPEEINLFLKVFLSLKAKRGSDSNFLSSSEWNEYTNLCNQAGIKRDRRQLQDKFKALKSAYVKYKSHSKSDQERTKDIVGIELLEAIHGDRSASRLESIQEPNQTYSAYPDNFVITTETFEVPIETQLDISTTGEESAGESDFNLGKWIKNNQNGGRPRKKRRKSSGSISALAKALEPQHELLKQLIDQQQKIQMMMEDVLKEQQEFNTIYKDSQAKFHYILEQMLEKL